MRILTNGLLKDNMNSFWNENRKLLLHFLKLGANAPIKDRYEENMSEIDNEEYNNQFY